MNKYILILICFFSIFKTLGQNNEKLFLFHGSTNELAPCFQVSEMIIKSDSTFKLIGYDCMDKKKWKNYHQLSFTITQGKIIKKDKIYVFQNYIDGIKTDTKRTVIIKRNKLFICSNFETGTIEKLFKFKRVKNSL